MSGDLAAEGLSVHIVAINVAGGDSSMRFLTDVCTFDCLQDVASVNVWGLMGGGKDDIYVYRQGGRLAPAGFFPALGPRNTNLSSEEGYKNIRDSITSAVALGPGEACPPDTPPAGAQRAGDFNSDGALDIADPIALLAHLFAGGTKAPPCEPAGLDGEGNRAILDVNGDDGVDLSDAVFILNHLFAGGPPPVQGTGCIAIVGCPDACSG